MHLGVEGCHVCHEGGWTRTCVTSCDEDIRRTSPHDVFKDTLMLIRIEAQGIQMKRCASTRRFKMGVYVGTCTRTIQHSVRSAPPFAVKPFFQDAQIRWSP